MYRMKKLIISLAIAISAFPSCRPEEDKQKDLDYTDALRQVHAEAFFEQGLRGQNVKIGILDFGFANLWQDPALEHLRNNGQIVFTADYSHSDSGGFYKNVHGTNVLRYMAGIDPGETRFRDNLASGARFYLAMVTANFEKKSDERVTEYMIDSALYDMYNLGVRVINLSMGFWDEYSDENKNYSADQMDGKTTLITRICQKWAMKGMIIVNSAGNTGEYSWKVIWAPSDAPDVIAVGAARFPDKVFKASYSGRGNPDISYVKPDLIAFTPWGTSFSANVVTGIVACMLQKDSTLTLPGIRNILFRSGTLYPYPNNFVGYGIPDCRKILAIMDNRTTDSAGVDLIRVKGRRYTLPASGPDNVIFEKTDHYRVRRQIIDEASNGTVTVSRKSGILFTTVVTGEKAYEIQWEQH
jgi:hypothetical protein